MGQNGITLYKHSIGKEMGLIHLVVASGSNPEEEVSLVLTSERSKDEGVVFTVDMFREDYDEMCNDNSLTTMEGCILSTFGEDIQVEEIPEEPPPERPEPDKKKNTLRVLQTPNLWRHKWGRCCCVRRGDELVPVTPEAIAEGSVPWWNNHYTPFQIDLINAAHNPEHKMHVLLSDDMLCGRCNHHVWCVFDEDVPEELPTPPKYVDVTDPLCDDQQALDEIAWETKAEAWEIFYSDEHNHEIIQQSGLAIERANQRNRFSQSKKFEGINRAQSTGSNVYTIKQAFYVALGRARSGTWADFDLGMLRLVKGIEEVDIPAEILDMVRLDDASAQRNLREQTEQRATKATVDSEATILQFMLDDDARKDDDDDGLDDDDFTEIPIDFLEDDDDDSPEVLEPIKQRPKAKPRVVNPRQTTERPTPKRSQHSKHSQRTSSKKTEARRSLIEACTQLSSALTTFVQLLQEEDNDEDDDSSNNNPKRTGG